MYYNSGWSECYFGKKRLIEDLHANETIIEYIRYVKQD